MDKKILQVADSELKQLRKLINADKKNYVGTPKLKKWQKRAKALNKAIKDVEKGI